MTRRIGEVPAATCSYCDLTRCPCGPGERPVAFVRGVCPVPTLSAPRADRTRPRTPRPGTGRHRRPFMWSRHR